VPGLPSLATSNNDSLGAKRLTKAIKGHIPEIHVMDVIWPLGIGWQHGAAMAHENTKLGHAQPAPTVEPHDDAVDVAWLARPANLTDTGDDASAIEARLMARHIPEPRLGSSRERFAWTAGDVIVEAPGTR
jgi:hypothetical protein